MYLGGRPAWAIVWVRIAGQLLRSRSETSSGNISRCFTTGSNWPHPYDSVEKALANLATKLNAMSPEELENLSADATQRWTHFRQAFIDSGLSLKHRGIIAGLARSRQSLDLPPEFDHLLNLYSSAR